MTSIERSTIQDRSPRKKNKRARHLKSRNGCYSCKSRRVKCDEEKPKCGACFLRGEPCEFPDNSTQRPRIKAAAPSHTATDVRVSGGLTERSSSLSSSLSPHPLQFDLKSPPGSIGDGGITNSHTLNMVDLRLLSHFITETAKRMSLKPARQRVWEVVVPGIATRNEFLMHLLLALAGLDHFYPGGPSGGFFHPGSTSTTNKHILPSTTSNEPPGMRASSPSLKYDINTGHLGIIVSHHQIGLQGFREALSNLSSSNCTEVFVGSMLLVGFAFGSLRVRNMNDDSQSSPLPRSANDAYPPPPRLDWIYLVRGLTSVVKQHWPELRMGPLRDSLYFAYATDDWQMYPREMFTALDSLQPPQSWSQRITKFCKGACKSLSDLRSFLESSSLSSGVAESTTDPMQQNLSRDSSQILSEQKSTIQILEDMYMRILLVAQITRDHTQSHLDIQADIEDAGVMAWPELISSEYLASLNGAGTLSNLSYTILAHLYLIFSLFEEYWYLKWGFDEEIMKIDGRITVSENRELITLMRWPVSVITP